MQPGKTALITGATGGIGRAVARQLAAAGARLVLLSRSAERLQALAREIGATGAECIAVDLTRTQVVAGAAARVLDRHRELHVLLHCAGRYVRDDIAVQPAQELRDAFEANYWAPLELTRQLMPALRAGQADVVFVNSSIVARPAKHLTAYRAAKSALQAAAESLREECNPAGIRVLSIFPGRTATGMQEEVHRLEGLAYRPERLIQPDDVATLIVQAISLPRTAEVTEIHVRPMLPP